MSESPTSDDPDALDDAVRDAIELWRVPTSGLRTTRPETVAEPPVETGRAPGTGDGAVAERLRDPGYV